jgi:hypothetical protein
MGPDFIVRIITGTFRAVHWRTGVKTAESVRETICAKVHRSSEPHILVTLHGIKMENVRVNVQNLWDPHIRIELLWTGQWIRRGRGAAFFPLASISLLQTAIQLQILQTFCRVPSRPFRGAASSRHTVRSRLSQGPKNTEHMFRWTIRAAANIIWPNGKFYGNRKPQRIHK